uniref:NADH-ubiquinone oxidoreductase chain 4 n=1 Tax=Unio pictorum TaxID=55837 RepID=E5EW12_UNIPI|nr:NADH dehydrogenase subunit 4 [Unio pictorum]ADE18125.1 NADH dehydrogenase subunit 4 [Unio pictorum]ADE18138.1 NADH dehydrogenase subunit 4 [Unio pictorum]ADE18151.1 NADH dehydrogenase subunit 4 [Unio pictorum]ADE18164.1 NADH dehydrogenase subunit 4 [Unio pictorum]ADE18177.1 NADH dehydrogenase subunit 4 [Unio pictorum]
MFSLGIVGVLLVVVSGLGQSVFWWSVLWGCVIMYLVSLGLWFSSLGLAGCWGEALIVDSFSFSLVSLTILISGLSMLASVRDVQKLNNKTVEFIFSILVLTLVLVFCFSVGSLLNFYIMFEFSLIPILLIILGWGYQPERLQAGKYMLLYTVSASLPLLVLIVLILSKGGSVFWGWSFLKFEWGWLATFCASLAFLVKLPIYGFHLWLPKAHVEAPVAGSMILAGVLLKLGGYGLVRFFYTLELFSTLTISIIFCVGLMGGIVASMVCFAQNDVKALVAYSSVGHMSLVMGGVYSNTDWGWLGCLLMMIAHGLCSSGMFFLASETYKCYGTRSLFLVKGGLVLVPGVALCWFLMCAINMAAPPSLNLWGELMLGISILSYSMVFGLLTGVMTFLSGVYSWYLYSITQHGQYPLWVRGVSMAEEYANYIISFVLVLMLSLTGVILMLFI